MSHSRSLSLVFTVFILLALILVSAVPVSRVSAATIVVNSFEDNEIDDSACTLREAIIAANTDSNYRGCPAGNGADTITLPAGTYTLTSQLPNITTAITINGGTAENTMIQASTCSPVTSVTPGVCTPANYRVFWVNSTSALTLNSLTARHGNIEGIGGGIINYGTLTVTNCIFSENSATGYGGAIANLLDGTVTVTDSEVIGNKAGNWETSGGWGGGISNYNGTLSVTRSTISGNTSNDLGGGIYNRQGSLTITDTSLSYNSSRSGGGIFNFVDDALTINSSTLSKNQADQQGGGVYNGGILTVINSTFSQNVANEGGGIFGNSGSSVDLLSSTFSENSAAFYGGIAINSTLNFSNTIIANSINSQDCYVWTDGTGSIGTNAHNLVGDGSCSNGGTNFLSGDPKLGPLANNGGPTQTHALLADSPAIDAGNCALAENFDQRGEPRPAGASCDIGAFEFNPAKDGDQLIFLPLIMR